MEAATSTDATRKLDGDKAQRIIAAMRASVGTRGASGSTRMPRAGTGGSPLTPRR